MRLDERDFSGLGAATARGFFNGASRRAKLVSPQSSRFIYSDPRVAAGRGNIGMSATISRQMGETIPETSYNSVVSNRFNRERRSTPAMYGLGRLGRVNAKPYLYRGSPDTEVLGETTITDDILSIVKSALPIYQQQQIFNQQLKTGQVPQVYNNATVARPPTNWGKIALLGALGIGSVFALSKVMGR